LALKFVFVGFANESDKNMYYVSIGEGADHEYKMRISHLGKYYMASLPSSSNSNDLISTATIRWIDPCSESCGVITVYDWPGTEWMLNRPHFSGSRSCTPANVALSTTASYNRASWDYAVGHAL
jgi:hypothetical protein